jgi:hypothetical protein
VGIGEGVRFSGLARRAGAARPFAQAPVPAAKPAGLSARRRRVVRPIASTIIDTTQ